MLKGNTTSGVSYVVQNVLVGLIKTRRIRSSVSPVHTPSSIHHKLELPVSLSVQVSEGFLYKNMSQVERKPVFGFPTKHDTNWAVQPQKMVRGLKCWILEVEGL